MAAKRKSTAGGVAALPIPVVLPPMEAKLAVTGDRFHHGARFLRWRPDKRPDQCTFEQIEREARPAKLISELLQT